MVYRYDSTHVGLHRDANVHVSTEDGKLCVNEHKISVFSERDPKNIPWGSVGMYKQSSVKTFNISSNLLSFLTKVPHRNGGNSKRANVP